MVSRYVVRESHSSLANIADRNAAAIYNMTVKEIVQDMLRREREIATYIVRACVSAVPSRLERKCGSFKYHAMISFITLRCVGILLLDG
jgi:hypothetical protein